MVRSLLQRLTLTTFDLHYDRAGVLPCSEGIFIAVGDQQGGKVNFKVKGNLRISCLYRVCAEKTGIHRNDFNLYHLGVRLLDTCTVDEYQILDGDKLELLLCQVGD